MIDPRQPIDELARMGKAINDLRDRLDRALAPSGTQAYQAVAKLQALVEDIQQQLDDYISNGTYTKAQIDAMRGTAPGNFTVVGTLSTNGTATVGGDLIVPAAYNKQLTDGPRKTAWIDAAGNLGVTA
jgi:hypothetical protein